MRVETDDELGRVDRRWLGPPGRELPFAARYVAWGLGLAFFALGQTLMSAAGAVSIINTAIVIMGSAIATTLVLRTVNPDKPVRVLARAAWSEISSPRPDTTPAQRSVPGHASIRLRADVPAPSPGQRGAAEDPDRTQIVRIPTGKARR